MPEARPAVPAAKTCSKCKVEKPGTSEFFYKSAASRAPDGLQYYCKECAKTAARSSYAKDPAASNARRVANRRANPERDAATHRRWAAANPEAQREHWRKTKQTRRAARRGNLTEYVDPLVLLEMDDGVCGICGGDVDPFEFHMDHVIPVSRGGDHSYANMQVSHPRCNKRKRDIMPWDYQTDGSSLSGSPRECLAAQAVV